MKSFFVALVLFALIAGANAQNSGSSWFKNTQYKLKDGHSIVLREDGKISYDGRFMFERYDDQSMTTENYIPFHLTITNEKGKTEKVFAALEMHEYKTNGKVWFVIYEGALGDMRQSFFTTDSEQQARL